MFQRRRSSELLNEGNRFQSIDSLPFIQAYILTVLLGAALLAEGVLNLCVALSTVKIVKNQRPDVIETEYFEVREYR